MSHESDEDVAAHVRAVPGTEILFDEGSNNGALVDLSQLKHRAKGDSRVLLVPQPSTNDPNDPLNWASTKKNVAFFNGCWYAFMGAITGPIMAAGIYNSRVQCEDTALTLRIIQA
jgi:hypothetical protein